MIPTNLIQRLTLPGKSSPNWAFELDFTPKQIEAIKPVMGFDLMANSRKYYRYIPTALNYLASFPKEDLVSRELYFEDKSIRYVCPRTLGEFSVRDTIMKTYDDESSLSLNEPTYFKDSLLGKKPEIVGWLELNNGFAFFSDRNLYYNFRDLIGNFLKD